MTEYAEGTYRNAADEQDRQDLTFSMAGLYRGYVKCVPLSSPCLPLPSFWG